MFVICIISVLSKLTKTLSDLLLTELVSIYINPLPIGGKDVAPESPVGLFVFVDRKKFYILPLILLSIFFIPILKKITTIVRSFNKCGVFNLCFIIFWKAINFTSNGYFGIVVFWLNKFKYGLFI